GNVLFEKSQDVQVGAASSKAYLTLAEKDLFAESTKASRDKSFLVVDLEVGGKNVSRNSVFFDVTHNVELPANPKIESSVTKTADGYAVTLQSPVLARGVYLSFGDVDASVSDNYFDLLPKEPVTISVKSPAAVDQLQGAMKVISLTDAYASQGTKY